MKDRQFMILLLVILCFFLSLYKQNQDIYNYIDKAYQQYRIDRSDLIDRLNEIKILINEKELK